MKEVLKKGEEVDVTSCKIECCTTPLCNVGVKPTLPTTITTTAPTTKDHQFSLPTTKDHTSSLVTVKDHILSPSGSPVILLATFSIICFGFWCQNKTPANAAANFYTFEFHIWLVLLSAKFHHCFVNLLVCSFLKAYMLMIV